MNFIRDLKPDLLRKAANLKEQIELLQRKFSKLLKEAVPESFPGPTQVPTIPIGPKVVPGTLKDKSRRNRKRRLKERQHLKLRLKASAAHQRRMPARGTKRKSSAAVRTRLSALAKARWAKAKKAGRTTL